MVLSGGKIVEYENPTTLLSQKSSIFYDMARDAGIA